MSGSLKVATAELGQGPGPPDLQPLPAGYQPAVNQGGGLCALGVEGPVTADGCAR